MTENDPKDSSSIDHAESPSESTPNDQALTTETSNVASPAAAAVPAQAPESAAGASASPASSSEHGPSGGGGGGGGGDDHGDGDGEGDDGEGDESGEEGAEASGDGTATADDGTKKKRRRRRRKKKGGAEGAEAGAAGAEGGATGEPRPERAERGERPDRGERGGRERGGHGHEGRSLAHAPFGRYFENTKDRHHAFSTGEIVAGIVTQVADGTAIVDLFGKATAIIDVLEPREIEPIPEPATPPAPPTAELVQADGADGATADVASVASDAAVPTVPTVTAVTSDEAAAETPTDETSAPAAIAAAEPTDAPIVTDPSTASATSAGSLEAAAHDAAAAEAAVLAEAEDAVDEDEEGRGASDEAAKPTVENAAAAPPEVGEILKGRIGSVSESGHVVLINRYIDKGKAKERIREHQANRRRVQGVVYGFNRGGFDVIVEGIRVFCPSSAMALDPIEDPTAFVGKKLEFTLPPSKGGRSIVVSRRTLLEREQRSLRRDKMRSLEVGTRLKGRVTGLREYGVLVDIGGGLEGLVHLSELGWSRGTRPSDVGPYGTEVDVEVTKVLPISRKERFGKIGLSIRACLPDPWEQHKDILKEGHAQLARVTRTADFGAFLELAPGLEGMLHISELGGRDIQHASQVLKDGEMVAVLLERIDRGQRRISLSKLSPKEAEALANGSFTEASGKAPKPSSLVTVVIEKVEHHGFQVQVQGVSGRKGRGYLSNRDLGEFDGEKRRRLTVGSTLEVKVTGVDRDGALKMSVKAKQVDEERNAVRNYKRESAGQGFGTFGDLLRAKIQR